MIAELTASEDSPFENRVVTLSELRSLKGSELDWTVIHFTAGGVPLTASAFKKDEQTFKEVWAFTEQTLAVFQALLCAIHQTPSKDHSPQQLFQLYKIRNRCIQYGHLRYSLLSESRKRGWVL